LARLKQHLQKGIVFDRILELSFLGNHVNLQVCIYVHLYWYNNGFVCGRFIEPSWEYSHESTSKSYVQKLKGRYMISILILLRCFTITMSVRKFILFCKQMSFWVLEATFWEMEAQLVFASKEIKNNSVTSSWFSVHWYSDDLDFKSFPNWTVWLLYDAHYKWICCPLNNTLAYWYRAIVRTFMSFIFDLVRFLLIQATLLFPLILIVPAFLLKCSYHASTPNCSTRHAIKRQVFGADHSCSLWYIWWGPCSCLCKHIAVTLNSIVFFSRYLF
jgi:hypothetical protein